MSAKFLPLSAHAQTQFEVLREHIQQIYADQPEGVAFVLNALFGVSGETVAYDVDRWLDAVEDVDPRVLNASCHDSYRLVIAGDGDGVEG